MDIHDRQVTFSDQLVVSCGTISIDPSRKTVLLIKHRQENKYLLPKGRKNQGETLEAAAIRETTEETGFLCKLVLHSAPTRAPHPDPVPLRVPGETPLHQEPIAVQQRVYRDWGHKFVFWYLAEADSTQVPLELVDDGQYYDAVWLDFKAAVEMATHKDDSVIIQKAIEIWSSRTVEPMAGNQ